MSQGDIETATIFTRAMRKIQSKFTALVLDIGGKAAISGQTFTGDIAAPKITASTGILFGTDTAAANTLDDYEEGTWTATNPAVTVSVDNANYTKIGNSVSFALEVDIPVNSSSSNMTLSLPFTSSEDSTAAIGYTTATFGNFTALIQGDNVFLIKDGSTIQEVSEYSGANIRLAGHLKVT
jgi:hypothetical protein